MSEVPEILNLDQEEISDLSKMGNILSLSGLIKITLKADGCISSENLIKLFRFSQPELGPKFLRFKVQEFIDICRKGESFLTYDDSNGFCFPNSIKLK